MRIADLNWMQVEALLRREDRCVLPLGSTEQHAYLSLCSDSILAERMAVEAAAPFGVPVFPVVPFGMTPSFTAYPGTVNLRMQSYASLLKDVLDSVAAYGFRRIMVVNGHGGNAPASAVAAEWRCEREGVHVIWHDWWRAPRTHAKVVEIDPVASHASWMEDFPWTRLDGVEVPSEPKAPIPIADMRGINAREMRERIGDGNFGGLYRRSDGEMAAVWAAAVEETREMLENGWARPVNPS